MAISDHIEVLINRAVSIYMEGYTGALLRHGRISVSHEPCMDPTKYLIAITFIPLTSQAAALHAALELPYYELIENPRGSFPDLLIPYIADAMQVLERRMLESVGVKVVPDFFMKTETTAPEKSVRVIRIRKQ